MENFIIPGLDTKTAFEISSNKTKKLNTNDTSLNLITETISLNKLSPFQTFSQCCENISCVKTFINNQNGEILTEKNIDILFSQLINAGYTIEYEMTKLIKDKKLVCFISKN